MQTQTHRRTPKLPRALHVAGLAFCLLLAACGTDLYDQPKLKPYQSSPLFADGAGSRPLEPGVVAQGHMKLDDAFYTGMVDGQPVTEFPPQVTVDDKLIARGQQRYAIYCTPCHGANANGNGVASGYFLPRPANFYTPTIKLLPVGRYFDTITNGKGGMFSYAYRVSPEDRWAIIAWIRKMQADNPNGPPAK